MLLTLVLLQAAYGIVILFPVNATGPNKDLPETDLNYSSGNSLTPSHFLTPSGSGIISMSNINHGSPRLVAHMFSVLFNSAVIFVFLYREFKLVIFQPPFLC
jgi:hypothetical protein